MERITSWLGIAALSALMASSTSFAQGLGPNNDPVSAAKNGWSMEQGRAPGWALDQHKRLTKAIDGLQPQRPGVIDTYIVAVGLDADGVFTKEAIEAGKVLERRYGAAGRSITLATGTKDMPQGSPDGISTILAGVAEKMDLKEDVLILYTTSHGDPNVGLVYQDTGKGLGLIAPARMANLLDDLGFQRRMLIISACFSGVFIPALKNENSIVLTAASSTRSSFGCSASNDWTFFGDALLNNALRKPQGLESAVKEAHSMILGWESGRSFQPSDPQMDFGSKTSVWLKAIEANMPKDATKPVGKPANDFDKE
jgi:hypothetical protein